MGGCLQNNPAPEIIPPERQKHQTSNTHKSKASVPSYPSIEDVLNHQ